MRKFLIICGLVLTTITGFFLIGYIFLQKNPEKMPCIRGGSRSYVGGSGWECHYKGTKIVPY